MDRVITFSLFLGVVWCVFVPYVLVGVWRVYQRRHDEFVAKRYFTYIVFESLSKAGLGFGFTFHAWYFCLIHDDVEMAWYKPQNVVSMLDVNMLAIAQALMIHCFLMRTWHIMFDLHWSIQSQQNQWMRHINASTFQNNWWIEHRQTFGNAHWTVLRLFLPALCAVYCARFVTLLFAFTLDDSDKSRISGTVFWFATLCMYGSFAALQWKLSPKSALWEETLLFKEEKRVHAVVGACIIATFVVFYVLLSVMRVIPFAYSYIAWVVCKIVQIMLKKTYIHNVN